MALRTAKTIQAKKDENTMKPAGRGRKKVLAICLRKSMLLLYNRDV